MKKYIIVAPHADDEVIGCYELLASGLVKTVMFPTRQSMEEAIPSSEHFGFDIKSTEFIGTVLQNSIYLFPDPTYELHPEHRRLGSIGEELLRAGQDVIFYTTNMLSPYIHEVTDMFAKRSCLNTLYPKKADLWAYDHKYFLFEGYTKWIMKWED